MSTFISKTVPKHVLDSFQHLPTAVIVEDHVEMDLALFKQNPKLVEMLNAHAGHGLFLKADDGVSKDGWLIKVSRVNRPAPLDESPVFVAIVYYPETQQGECLQLARLMTSHFFDFKKS